MRWKWWSGVSHGIAGFSGPAARLPGIPGEAPCVHGKATARISDGTLKVSVAALLNIENNKARMTWGTQVPDVA